VRPHPLPMEVLRTKEVLTRRWAARALGDAERAHRAVVLPALMEKLKDEDLQVRVFAAEAIWNIAEEREVAIPTLLKVLQNHANPGRARERAAYALGRIGPPAKEAIPALKQATSDQSSWDVYVAATRALERILPAPDASK
jgi:HEAT repeat protein